MPSRWHLRSRRSKATRRTLPHWVRSGQSCHLGAFLPFSNKLRIDSGMVFCLYYRSSILASSRSSAEPHPREVASLGTRVMEAQMSADIENHLLQQKQFQFPKRQLGRVLLLDSVARTSFQRSGILLQSPLGACVAPQEVHLRDDCSAADRQTHIRTVAPRSSSLVSLSTESLPSSTSCSSFYHSFSPPSSILPLSVPLSTSPPSRSSLPSASSLLLSAPSLGSSPIVTPSDLSVHTSSETNLPSVTLESASSSPPLSPSLPANLHYVPSITSHSMSTPSILSSTDHVLAPSLPSSLCKTCLVGVKGQGYVHSISLQFNLIYSD